MNQKLLLHSLILLFCLTEAGCRTVSIDSYPAGAKIYIDQKIIEEKTPHKFPVKYFTRGSHSISVEKEGYVAKNSPQTLTIGTSILDIIFSTMFTPVLIVGIFHNHWKDIVDDLVPFELIEVSKVDAQKLPNILSSDKKVSPMTTDVK